MNYFQDDIERAFDSHEGRRYKERARNALNKRMFKETAKFDSTWKRWRANREKLSHMRMGGLNSPTKVIAWDKVGYTVGLQLLNVFILIGCIFNGYWLPVLAIPLIGAANLTLLIRDRGQ